jgi:hypothetical protein
MKLYKGYYKNVLIVEKMNIPKTGFYFEFKNLEGSYPMKILMPDLETCKEEIDSSLAKLGKKVLKLTKIQKKEKRKFEKAQKATQ